MEAAAAVAEAQRITYEAKHRAYRLALGFPAHHRDASSVFVLHSGHGNVSDCGRYGCPPEPDTKPQPALDPTPQQVDAIRARIMRLFGGGK